MIDKRENDAEREKKVNVQSSDFSDLAKRRGHCYLIIHTAQVMACEGRQMSWEQPWVNESNPVDMRADYF